MAKKSRTTGAPASLPEVAADAVTRMDLPAAGAEARTLELATLSAGQAGENDKTALLDVAAVQANLAAQSTAPQGMSTAPQGKSASPEAKGSAQTATGASTPPAKGNAGPSVRISLPEAATVAIAVGHAAGAGSDPTPAGKIGGAPRGTGPAARDPLRSPNDEPLTGPLGLDVRMLWRGDTHAARFFQRPQAITLGADGTFALPPDAMGKKDGELTVLVEPHPTAGFALRVDNASAKGHLLVDGTSYDLVAVRAGSAGIKGPVVPLTATTHAYVQFDEFTFLLSRAGIPPAPPLSLWSRENTIFLLCLLLAIAFVAGPLVAGFNSAEYRNRAKLSYLEQVEQDLRKPETIEVLIQEEKKEEAKAEEKKEEEKKEAEAVPIKPETKPEEKKPDELQKQLKDLSDEDRKAKVTDLVKDELARNTAAIDDALKDVGGPTTKLFAEDDGDGAANPNAQYGADTSDRAAGALAGDPNGRRGAGDGSETGRQVAAGLGKDSSLNGKEPSLDVHEKKQSLVRVGGSVGDTTGELPKSVIKAYIATKMGAIKACYQKGLQSNPDLSGKIKVRFLIQPNGAVNPAKVDESTIGNDAVESCVMNNVKAWKFPQAKGGGVTTVVYPFVFASH